MNALEIIGATVVALFVLWMLIQLKTSRPDGTLVRGLHKYRTMMFHIMPTRNESVVYFDEFVDAEKLLQYMPVAEEKFGFDVDITHVVVAGCALGFVENPKMNQFVAGYRLYERKGIWLSFSMKRKKLDQSAKLAVVKQRVEEGMNFKEFCESINAKINVERSDKKTYADKEYDLFTAIPRPVLQRATRLFRQLDYWNLLPGSFLENDPMYTSMFIANLGSLGMRAGLHHLYEWGTCPLFMMVGKIEERPVVVDGEIVIRKMMPIRFSYDERIDDGLTAGRGIRTFVEVLSDPFAGLGCVREDGSDVWPLDIPRAERAA